MTALPVKPRAIAFYLPQFHPIPENDEWWGRGFTEWTNTAKAAPLFPGHYQPHIPADLGFYDLRLPETRAAQAALARQYGVTGFCYYHYWFAGRRLLERPFDEVLASGAPDFPFCLCWANQSWTGVWYGAPEKILVEQTYPGLDDQARHFGWLLRAFTDRRYITVEGKPLFVIFQPGDIPAVGEMIRFWRSLARAAGLPGLHIVAMLHGSIAIAPEASGFDATITVALPLVPKFYEENHRRRGVVMDHAEFVDRLIGPDRTDGIDYPCVGPSWDNTPRSGGNGLVLKNSSPALFRRNLRQAMARMAGRPPEHRIIFLKAWNEWAEGNHLEPDLKFGRGWLEAVRDEIGAG